MYTRRSVLSYVGLLLTASTRSQTNADRPDDARFEPAVHAQDAWLGRCRGVHRTIIDAATPHAAGEALLFANNIYNGNKSGYGVAEYDTAIVICLRHLAVAFAFTDIIWAKYGRIIGGYLNFTDPKTGQAPERNVFCSTAHSGQLPSAGNTIDSAPVRGTRFAICGMAAHYTATQISRATGRRDAAVYQELMANTIPQSKVVVAGVVTVNRAQEYGYTLLTTA